MINSNEKYDQNETNVIYVASGQGWMGNRVSLAVKAIMPAS
jgi:hypothetical protein